MTAAKKLPAICDSISAIPTAFRECYDKGDDGRWRLQVAEVDGISLGDVAGAKADADRCFGKLAESIRNDVIGKALKAAGGDRTLLEPHLAVNVQVDRATFAVRVIGADGKFTQLDSLIADLRQRPGFAAAFNDPPPEKLATKDEKFGGHKTFTDWCIAEKSRAKAKPSAPRPVTLDSRDPRFNYTAAASWAAGDPARIAEIQTACGRR